ncbi:NYN domain-containing protein [Simiduia sp. 21SJ11W-1]|uniref:LabA-like NYN domain-containing protein n=1 Tax=Simiduia sp. 21SJ11W-1 TaxID=2909669 RepID=UPI00209F32C5|nr:NYN domain-containing protein [Simiduia sp. 21SJ11W-1]UTA47799.1 NYN domain-containing protein [Simiduia sp. 21SJ11W-1]
MEPLLRPRIGIFADVQNIYYCTRDRYQRQFNYRALWQQLSEQGEICQAFAYAIHRGDAGQLKFQTALRSLGFTVKLKPFIQRSDGSAKGDWDVGITIDVLEYAPRLDKIVLLSGDGDFDLLLARVGERFGVRTEVYGVPGLTAQSLIDVASHYHPIEASLLR